MIVRPVLAILALVAPLASFGVGSQDQEAETQDRVEEIEDDATEDDLHETMERLQTEMKGLRRVLKPEAKKEGLEACDRFAAIVLETMAMSPEPLEPLEGIDLIEYEVDFKKRMAEIYNSALDLKVALAKDDTDAAKTLYRSLGQGKNEGHTKFIDGK